MSDHEWMWTAGSVVNAVVLRGVALTDNFDIGADQILQCVCVPHVISQAPVPPGHCEVHAKQSENWRLAKPFSPWRT